MHEFFTWLTAAVILLHFLELRFSFEQSKFLCVNRRYKSISSHILIEIQYFEYAVSERYYLDYVDFCYVFTATFLDPHLRWGALKYCLWKHLRVVSETENLKHWILVNRHVSFACSSLIHITLSNNPNPLIRFLIPVFNVHIHLLILNLFPSRRYRRNICICKHIPNEVNSNVTDVGRLDKLVLTLVLNTTPVSHIQYSFKINIGEK